MSSSRSARSGAIDPLLYARLVRVGWWFAGFAAACSLAFSLMTLGLPSSTWYSIVVGKIAGGAPAYLLPNGALIVTAWSVVIVCAAIVVMARALRASLRPGIVVLLIIGIAVSATPFASLVASAIPQLGAATPLSLAAANQSVVPVAAIAGIVGTITALAAIIAVAVNTRTGASRPAGTRR